jgi:tetratricopeptide (TPR) repeat protein
MDLIKKFFLILILIFTTGWAQDQTVLFKNGNQYYQQGDYQKAIDQYEQILEQGFESGALYFNLGNSYYKLNELGKARLNYERAAEFIQGDEALNENLRILKMRLVDQIEAPPQFFLDTWWNYILNLFSVRALIWIVAILFWVMIASLVFRIYHSTRGHITRGKALFVFSLVVFLIFALISAQKIYKLETEHFAVIMNPSVTLLAEPKIGGTEVFVLHEGTKVKIERRTNEWLEIKLVDGKTGWLTKDNLEVI